ncbi:MAG: RluA family pseudouridine synthase [Cyclobacteriaceae bacterium]
MKTKGRINFEDLILFENPNYIVINKPPHLATLEDRNDTQNILSLAKAYHPDSQVCHRLDKETSGVLAIAKHPDAYRHFAMSLEKRQVKKIYHAVLNGIHDFQDLEADQPIYSSNSKSRVDFHEGKPSLTLVSTLEHFKANTLIKCFPVTGRLHQIRIHLAYHHAPIVSDIIYGGDWVYLSSIKKKYKISKDSDEQPLIRRVALHAFSLSFKDFGDDSENILTVEAPYPKDFEVLIKQLRKNL